MTVKTILCGFGKWGMNHARVIDSSPLAELTHIVDPYPPARSKALDLYPRAKIVASVDLIKDEFDAVVVASGTETHYTFARKLLRFGYHCLIEKPWAFSPNRMRSDTKSAKRLIDSVKPGQVVTAGYILLHHPAVQRMIELGITPVHGCATRLNFGTIRAYEDVVESVMPHDIALACRFMGTPQYVHCFARSIFSDKKADEAMVIIRFASGDFYIHASWWHPSKVRLFALKTRKHCYELDGTKPVLDSLSIRPIGDGAKAGYLKTHEPLAEQFRNFCEAINGNEEIVATRQLMYNTASVLEAARISITRCGAEVPVRLGKFAEQPRLVTG